MIQVLVMASSQVVQAGLEALLSGHPDITVSGSSPDWDPLTDPDLHPQVILIDAGDSEGELIATLLNTEWIQSPPALILLADDVQHPTVLDALRLGIRGVVSPDAGVEELQAAVEAVAVGLTVLPPETLEALLASPSPRIPLTPAPQSLTARELEILNHLAEGSGNKTIAQHLCISEHTVKFHVGSILTKLNASSRTEAVAIGARHGWILL